MALVTRRSGNLTVEGRSAMTAGQLPASLGLVAGEDLDAAAPCYIASNGTVLMSNGTAANAAAVVRGYTGKSYKSGEPVTLFGPGVLFDYSSTAALTPGATYYVGATKGRIDTAATTGDAVGIGFAVTTSVICFTRIDPS